MSVRSDATNATAMMSAMDLGAAHAPMLNTGTGAGLDHVTATVDAARAADSSLGDANALKYAQQRDFSTCIASEAHLRWRLLSRICLIVSRFL